MADRKRSVKVYRTWADRAWCEHSGSDCGEKVSSAYEAGFKDGFVDYVFAGGSGEPPPVPPRQYWNVGQRNPNGHAEATDWFAGFRSGAQVAHNEGYREQTVVPASVFFGPQEGCWEDQPDCEESFLAPIPEYRNPELLPPGQLDSKASSAEFSPLLPSVDSPVAEESSSSIPPEEEMPLLKRGSKKSAAPRQPEPSEPAPSDPPPPARPRVPARPESEPGIDEIFDPPALKLGVTKPHRVRQTQAVSSGRKDFEVRQARAAFAKQPESEQVRNSRGLDKPARTNSEVSILGEDRQLPAARQTIRSSTSSSARIPRSDDRAEQMFRRLSR